MSRLLHKIQLWKIKRTMVKQVKFCTSGSCFQCGKYKDPEKECPYYAIRKEYIRLVKSNY